MTWEPCQTHAFEPLSGWSGRYRCKICYVISYRNLVAPKGGPHHDDQGRPEAIPNAHVLITYKCKKCHGDSTKRGGVCPACREDKDGKPG